MPVHFIFIVDDLILTTLSLSLVEYLACVEYLHCIVIFEWQNELCQDKICLFLVKTESVVC